MKSKKLSIGFALFCAILVIVGVSHGALPTFVEPSSVVLAWDASASSNVTYRLYAHTNALSRTNLMNATAMLSVGTNLTAVVTGMTPATWYFVTTAVNVNGVESEPSNMVIVSVPPAPANLRTVTLQFNGTVSGTNWQDAGFFRIQFR